jgi:hypothetical protein
VITKRRIRHRPEQVLHLAVADYLNATLPKNAVWIFVPNAGRRGRVEATMTKRMGLKAGFPDITVFYQGRACCVELKAPKNKRTPPDTQTEMHENLRKAGISTAIARSVDEVIQSLRTFGVPLREVTR